MYFFVLRPKKFFFRIFLWIKLFKKFFLIKLRFFFKFFTCILFLHFFLRVFLFRILPRTLLQILFFTKFSIGDLTLLSNSWQFMRIFCLSHSWHITAWFYPIFLFPPWHFSLLGLSDFSIYNSSPLHVDPLQKGLLNFFFSIRNWIIWSLSVGSVGWPKGG